MRNFKLNKINFFGFLVLFSYTLSLVVQITFII